MHLQFEKNKQLSNTQFLDPDRGSKHGNYGKQIFRKRYIPNIIIGLEGHSKIVVFPYMVNSLNTLTLNNIFLEERRQI